MGLADDLLHRIDGAQGIGYMHHRHQSGTFIEQLPEFIHDEIAIIVNGDYAQLRPGLFTQQLPGHDIGMVFHLGDDDLVTVTDVGTTITLCHQVDGIRRPAGEDDLLNGRCIDKCSNLISRLFICRGGLFTQCMHAAMDIGIVFTVITLQGFDNL